MALYVSEVGYGGHIRDEYDERDLFIVIFNGGTYEISRR